MPDRLGEIIIFSAAMDAGTHHIARSLRCWDVNFSFANPLQTMSRSVTMPMS